MEKKKNKPEDQNKQVHSEFETSVGNNFRTVREETGKKKKEGDEESALNELLPDEDSVKNEGAAADEPSKMNAPEEKKD